MIVVLLLAGLFLWNPEAVRAGVEHGLVICGKSILPGLFPFFVVTELWVRGGYGSQAAAPVMERAFHLSGTAASAVLLGAVGGYPVGARTAAQLYEQGQLSREDAQRCLLFCNNAGPAFVLSVVGVGVFRSTAVGVLLYLIHIGSAWLVGFFLRPKTLGASGAAAGQPVEGFSQRFTASVTQAGVTAVRVCTFVVFFSVVTACLPETVMLAGLLELAGGMVMLAECAWPMVWKFVGAAFFMGLGGLCVMMQSMAMVQQAGLSVGNLWLGKLLQALVSGALALLIAPMLSLPVPCMAVTASGVAVHGWILLATVGILKITSGKDGVHGV